MISDQISKLASNDNYTLHINGDRRYLTFPGLDEYPELLHLFTTRHGGVSTGCVSSWNFGEQSLDTDENILQNFKILADTMGISAKQFVRTQQTHTSNILTVSEADAGKGVTRPRGYTDIDGLVTDTRGLAIVTTHADCNSVYFYDPVKHVIGLAHSGWRGTLLGISRAMVAKMHDEFSSDPADLLAGTGPALCKDCFEVDFDVAEAFLKANPGNAAFIEERPPKYHIDLKAIIRRDLMDSGLKAENIMDMELCTKCHKEDFFSHRGHKGKRGLMAAVMMLRQTDNNP